MFQHVSACQPKSPIHVVTSFIHLLQNDAGRLILPLAEGVDSGQLPCCASRGAGRSSDSLEKLDATVHIVQYQIVPSLSLSAILSYFQRVAAMKFSSEIGPRDIFP